MTDLLSTWWPVVLVVSALALGLLVVINRRAPSGDGQLYNQTDLLLGHDRVPRGEGDDVLDD